MRQAPVRFAISIVVVVAIVAFRLMRGDGDAAKGANESVTAATPATQARPTATESAATGTAASREASGARPDDSRLVDAWRSRRSNTWVEGSGNVEALLPDDREGSRHQKFIVRIDRELTVLVSHNIDLAPRVPLDKGDAVSFRGEYVWNAKGGLVHWTHHDPQGKNGGWIRVGRQVYE
ncbi:MAG: DUF3465 domain-containing protein [Thermoanaerobaculia bacterium]|jgi:hypothetical protein